MVEAPYWAVWTLLAAAEANWEGIDGTSAAHGVDPGALPLGRFCNYVYVWLAERMSESQFQMFQARLATPPAGVNPESLVMTEEEEGRAFAAFAAMTTGGRAQA